ncbi:hypothetical protein PR048_031804 [Dryococelus australis]|uniref:Uncharacterized protein n=1 Tax=Dryococelus australis TaxID=614101 RepID=A0ABQ9G6B6_9NEOP|nr:hypothetical protein PR048_031804 [Dryococelus australis]
MTHEQVKVSGDIPPRLSCSPGRTVTKILRDLFAIRGRGGRAVRLLASHQEQLPDFRMWESCRTMPLVGWFSRGYPFSPLNVCFAARLIRHKPECVEGGRSSVRTGNVAGVVEEGWMGWLRKSNKGQANPTHPPARERVGCQLCDPSSDCKTNSDLFHREWCLAFVHGILAGSQSAPQMALTVSPHCCVDRRGGTVAPGPKREEREQKERVKARSDFPGFSFLFVVIFLLASRPARVSEGWIFLFRFQELAKTPVFPNTVHFPRKNEELEDANRTDAYPTEVTRQGNSLATVSLLASQQGEQGSIPFRVTPGFSCVPCRTMPLVGGFSRESPVPPTSSFRRCSIFTPINLIGSEDLALRAAQISSLAYSLPLDGIARRSIREDLGSNPGPAILISVRHGSPRYSRRTLGWNVSSLHVIAYYRLFTVNTFGPPPPPFSRQGEPGSIPGRVTGFSQVGIVPDDAVNRRVFSGVSRFPRPFISATLHIHFNHQRISRLRC